MQTTTIAKTVLISVITTVTLMSVAQASSSEAKIYKKSDGKIEAITLDTSGAPVSSNPGKSVPTILDFTADKYLDVCYTGSFDQGLKLVEALIVSADEGAIAQVKMDKVWANKQGRIRASVIIDDENGTRVEEFKFVACEPQL